jgi:hypothetical protein
MAGDMAAQRYRPGRTLRMQATLLLATAWPLAFADDAGRSVPMVPLSMPRLYDVTTETGMPHLDENLRYAVVRQRRCMVPGDLSDAFWMLEDVSLQDCRLEKTAQEPDGARYDLRCDGGHGTTGSAQWQIGPQELRGTLDVRLGGKNMTFYQRVVARAVPPAARTGAGPDRMDGAGLPDGSSCSSN